MNSKICDSLLLISAISMIFNYTNQKLHFYVLGGVIGSQLILFPLAIGFIYTIYCQYRYGNILKNFKSFSKYFLAYVGILSVSLCLGMYEYPYYNDVFSGPVNQVYRFVHILSSLERFGIECNEKILFVLYVFVKNLKNIVLEALWCFGSAYMFYCWYYNNYQRGIKIFCIGVLVSIIIFLAYGLLDVFYLAGNQYATELLKLMNPYIHPIRVGGLWHPPLLWKGQLRSIFAEPSNIGNFLGVAVPVMVYMFLVYKSKLALFCSMGMTFMVVLSKARTAYAMLFGCLLLIMIILICYKRYDLLKKYSLILLFNFFAFTCGIYFYDISNYVPKTYNILSSWSRDKMIPEKQASVELTKKRNAIVKKRIIENKEKNNLSKNNISKNVKETSKLTVALDENLASLASPSRRSNGARYALIKSNIRIGLKNPFLGVGTGLTSKYIVDNFTEDEKKNYEVKSWVSRLERKGIFSSQVITTAFNEVITRFATTGVCGLLIFYAPFAFIEYRLIKLAYKKKDSHQMEILFLLITLLSMLASSMNTSMTVIFAVWPILGIAFTLCRQNSLERKDAYQ